MLLRILSFSILAVCCGKADAITSAITPEKYVTLMNISPTDPRVIDLMNTPYEAYEPSVSAKADVGMSNVPVLDQGQYGTCVTFATTAALDARYALGDFISQQCTLQLIKALGNDLWNGAYYPSEVIDPLKQYGVVSKDKCNAGYPSPNVSITVDEYKKRVDSLASVSVSKVSYRYYSQNNLEAVKQAVLGGKRVLIGFLVNPSLALGYDLPGKRGGSWRCQESEGGGGGGGGNSELEKCLQQWPGFEDFCYWMYGGSISAAAQNQCQSWNAGHEVLIFGFDDDKKVLKIRNSWGVDVGDAGNWEMSYEFFQKQVIDQTVIN